MSGRLRGANYVEGVRQLLDADPALVIAAIARAGRLFTAPRRRPRAA